MSVEQRGSAPEVTPTEPSSYPRVIYHESLRDPNLPYQVTFDVGAFATVLEELGFPEDRIKGLQVTLKRDCLLNSLSPKLEGLPLFGLQGRYISDPNEIVIYTDIVWFAYNAACKTARNIVEGTIEPGEHFALDYKSSLDLHTRRLPSYLASTPPARALPFAESLLVGATQRGINKTLMRATQHFLKRTFPIIFGEFGEEAEVFTEELIQNNPQARNIISFEPKRTEPAEHKIIYRPKEFGPIREDFIPRRRVLIMLNYLFWAGVAGVVFRKLNRGQAENREAKPTPSITRTPEQTAKIVDEVTLAAYYKNAVLEKRTPEPDPVLISSTLYHAMVYFGLDNKTAEERARNFFISENENACGEGEACVVFLQAVFETRVFQRDWLDILSTLGHEAYHLAVTQNTEGNRSFVEDYGILGKFGVLKAGGFAYGQNSASEASSLIWTPGPDTLVSKPEEFFAEYGKVRYLQHLSRLGNRPVSIKDWLFKTGPERQALYQLHYNRPLGNASLYGGDFWGESMEPQMVDRLHLQGERFEFFRGLGERIHEENPNSRRLSVEDTAALGLVSFTDFSDYRLTGYQILDALSKEPVNPEIILRSARILGRRIEETSRQD